MNRDALLEAHCNLSGDRVSVFARAILFVLKAVLNLQLSVRCEAITGCDIGAP